MTAELFKGDVMRVTLGGQTRNREVLSQLLESSEGVSAHDIDDSGVLTVYVTPGAGEIDVVRALVASGMYALETLHIDEHNQGGHGAC